MEDRRCLCSGLDKAEDLRGIPGISSPSGVEGVKRNLAMSYDRTGMGGRRGMLNSPSVRVYNLCQHLVMYQSHPVQGYPVEAQGHHQVMELCIESRLDHVICEAEQGSVRRSSRVSLLVLSVILSIHARHCEVRVVFTG
jgi:hypothetical protein